MLKINNVVKTYDNIRALDDVSFSVEKGELFGLIGPDGAGKTSLFRIIATLLLADSGSVAFDGRDVVKDYRYVRQHVGYMPGRFSLYQDLSVRENLEFFATIFNTTFNENKHLIQDIFKQLEPFQNRKAGDLSGGMKQKLALSCALIHKPTVLLLDEPTTGVDAVSRKEFWQMLKNLKEEGISILVSTPYMDESTLCDRVALIQKGKVLQVDTPPAIAASFDRVVYQVKGHDLYGLLEEIRLLDGVHKAYPFGDSLHVYGPANLPLKEMILKRRPVTELEVEVIPANIEDSFMNLMVKEDG
ncbi:MAG: ABC transporter ATP-binding protein [Vicingaceae bacterium]